MEASRIAILVCFGVSVIGAGTDYWLKRAQVTSERDEKTALRMLSEITVAKLDVDVLEKEKENDDYTKKAANNRLTEFFEKTAKNDAKLDKGPAVGQEQKDTNRDGGFVDTTHELKWSTGGRNADRYPRDKIAAFMWFIEHHTNLLKVTKIKLQTDPKLRDDLWEPTIEVTERRPGVPAT